MSSAQPGSKEKIEHEFQEMLQPSEYLAFFFCSFAIYDMLLLHLGMISIEGEEAIHAQSLRES